ncbi:MAG: hypothetical protein LBS03_06625 [Bacteroidales bacterium]|nr:hypothetical protein [Bacteroidales bacterium]
MRQIVVEGTAHLPMNDYDKLIGHPEISIIGYVTAPEEGCFLVPEHGDKIEIRGMENQDC